MRRAVNGPTKAQLRAALIEMTKGLRSLRGMTGTKSSRALHVNIELGRAAMALGILLPGYRPDEDILERLS